MQRLSIGRWSSYSEEERWRRLVDRCAGIDVGQAEVVVCVRVPDRVTGRPAELVETYGTTTPDLMELRDWMAVLEAGVILTWVRYERSALQRPGH